MAGWHQRLNGHEFKETLGYGQGQGSLVCYSSWVLKEKPLIKFDCTHAKCFPCICSTFCYNYTQMFVCKHTPIFSFISLHSEFFGSTKKKPDNSRICKLFLFAF